MRQEDLPIHPVSCDSHHYSEPIFAFKRAMAWALMPKRVNHAQRDDAVWEAALSSRGTTETEVRCLRVLKLTFWLTILLFCGSLFSRFFASISALLGLWQSSPKAHPWSSACLHLWSLCLGGCQHPWLGLWLQHRYVSIDIWSPASKLFSVPTLSDVYGIAHLDDPPLAKTPRPERAIHHLLPFHHPAPTDWFLFPSAPVFS